MSSDRDDLENVQDLIAHLASTRFCGSLVVAFQDGKPTHLSRKEEWNPEELHRFLHRPVVVRKRAPDPKPEPSPAPAEPVTGETGGMGEMGKGSL